jgi:hypothetical protein
MRDVSSLTAEPENVNRSRPAVPPARGRRRRGDAEIADEPQEVRALEPERFRGVGAVAARSTEGRLDQAALELGDGTVVPERRRRQGH